MSNQTYYVRIDGGYMESSLPRMRYHCMAWLASHPQEHSVTIYTTPRCQTIIGRVRQPRTAGSHRYLWDTGRVRTLLPDGNVYAYKVRKDQ